MEIEAKKGYFGQFGGMFVPEILRTTFDQLIEDYNKIKADPAFWAEYKELMSTYSCRPTPITYAQNLSEHLGGAQIYLKREDLNHTGAHKANNVMGQGILTKRMGKTRVIAETGAGQHGVATATMAARMGFECTIYMGKVDVLRQRPNVFWMEKLGAEVIAVEEGSQTLKDAINAAFRDWAGNMDNTHYVLGTACGPHPFPEMVSWLQSIISEESIVQMPKIAGRLPDKIYACVGGGSNALGAFYHYLNRPEIELIGVEAGGRGLDTKDHAARLVGDDATIGVSQGYKTYFLQDPEGQMLETHSIAAGLDYVGVSPILSNYRDTGRVRFEVATDDEVIAAVKLLVKKEGIIPALESSHGLAGAFREAAKLPKDKVVLVNLSGRGDKDIFTIADAFEDKKWEDFIISKAEQYLKKRG
ncbi:MAG: tryptophan synthase subunit beta [SAR324 cluster bacterium]|nr:tryptophan synthase subunit beta [SAR324 cluster bacterium]